MLSLGIDPDLHHTAWALVNERLQPLSLGIVRIPIKLTGELAEVEMIHALRGAFPDSEIVVVESQRIYPGARSRPNDILRLARIAGACASACMFPRRRLHFPPPQMGLSIPKKVIQARTLAKLAYGPDQAHGWSKIRESERIHVFDALTFAVWGLTAPSES